MGQRPARGSLPAALAILAVLLAPLALHASGAAAASHVTRAQALVPPVVPFPGAVTFRLFATREGLVGGTTANGHVIAPRDRSSRSPPAPRSPARAGTRSRCSSPTKAAAPSPRSGTSAPGTSATTTGSRPRRA